MQNDLENKNKPSVLIKELSDFNTKLGTFKNIESDDFKLFIGVVLDELINNPNIVEEFNEKVDYFKNLYESREYKQLIEKIKDMIFEYLAQIDYKSTKESDNKKILCIINKLNKIMPDSAFKMEKFKQNLTLKDFRRLCKIFQHKRRKLDMRNSEEVPLNLYADKLLINLEKEIYYYNSLLMRQGIKNVDYESNKPFTLKETVNLIKEKIPKKLNSKNVKDLLRSICKYNPRNFLPCLNFDVYEENKCLNPEYESAFEKIQKILYTEPFKLKVKDFYMTKIIVWNFKEDINRPYGRLNNLTLHEVKDMAIMWDIDSLEDIVNPINNTLEQLIKYLEKQQILETIAEEKPLILEVKKVKKINELTKDELLAQTNLKPCYQEILGLALDYNNKLDSFQIMDMVDVYKNKNNYKSEDSCKDAIYKFFTPINKELNRILKTQNKKYIYSIKEDRKRTGECRINIPMK